MDIRTCIAYLRNWIDQLVGWRVIFHAFPCVCQHLESACISLAPTETARPCQLACNLWLCSKMLGTGLTRMRVYPPPHDARRGREVHLVERGTATRPRALSLPRSGTVPHTCHIYKGYSCRTVGWGTALISTL